MAAPRPPGFPSLPCLVGTILAVALTYAAADPPAEILKLDAELSASGENPASTALAERLLTSWAATDPRSALRFALRDEATHAVFLYAAGNVMETWARRDPVAARTFFEGLEEMPALLVAPSLLQGYGSQAPESALEWIHTGSTSESLRLILAKSIVGVYDSARRTGEIRLWLGLPGVSASPEGSTAAAEFARRLARRNPREAAAFTLSLPPQSAARAAALGETVRQWTAGDPAGCRTWLESSGLLPEADGALAPAPGTIRPLQ